MLDMIKELINEKKEFAESAKIIFEDATDFDFKDAIILGEEAEDDAIVEDEEPTAEDDIDAKDDGNDFPIKNDPDTEDDINDSTPNDQGDEPQVNDIDNLSIDDDLPDIAGKQTGEPIADSDDDILNIQIDLRSNTMSDALPIPPNGAGSAIPDDEDILSTSTKVDSGFGDGDDEANNQAGSDDILDQSIDNNQPINNDVPDQPVAEDDTATIDDAGIEENSEENIMNTSNDIIESVQGMFNNVHSLYEAINLGGADGNGIPEDPTADPTAPPEAADAPAPDAADAGQENQVTQAVRDKVSDAEGEGDASMDASMDMDMGSSSISSEDPEAKKTKVDFMNQLNKLSGDLDKLKAQLVEKM